MGSDSCCPLPCPGPPGVRRLARPLASTEGLQAVSVVSPRVHPKPQLSDPSLPLHPPPPSRSSEQRHRHLDRLLRAAHPAHQCAHHPVSKGAGAAAAGGQRRGCGACSAMRHQTVPPPSTPGCVTGRRVGSLRLLVCLAHRLPVRCALCPLPAAWPCTGSSWTSSRTRSRYCLRTGHACRALWASDASLCTRHARAPCLRAPLLAAATPALAVPTHASPPRGCRARRPCVPRPSAPWCASPAPP